MQWPIIKGIYSAQGAEWRTSLPVNLVPVPVATGISEGYLRPAEGIVSQGGTARGVSRGGIVWDGVLYRVLGANLVRVEADGSSTIIGNVQATGRAQLAYGFDYLAIAAGGKLWLYDKLVLTQVSDPDLGTVQGVVWVDGYFMTTDGEFLIVTDLDNPFSINPLKYGSSEADPDPVIALIKLRNEVYALNRYTVEVFGNVGGANFPFQRIEGAQIQKGAVGVNACCAFQDTLAFIGGGPNEAPSIYFGGNGQAQRVATRELDKILGEYSLEELSQAQLTERVYEGHTHLIVSLPRHTMVYDAAASAVLQQPVWFQLSSSMDATGPWLADTILRAYDKWTIAHPETGVTAYLTHDVNTHWGAAVQWRFSVPVVYNGGMGAVVHTLELVALTGREEGTVGTQYSTDGRDWSNPRWVDVSKRNARVQWRGQGILRNWRTQRFFSTANITPTRIEATVEALAY